MRDFMAMVDRLVDGNRELLPCRPTVEKEFLQMEILSALRKGGLLTKLVFKGGTCLRLCRSGERLSEDLDFLGGEPLRYVADGRSRRRAGRSDRRGLRTGSVGTRTARPLGRQDGGPLGSLVSSPAQTRPAVRRTWAFSASRSK